MSVLADDGILMEMNLMDAHIELTPHMISNIKSDLSVCLVIQIKLSFIQCRCNEVKNS